MLNGKTHISDHNVLIFYLDRETKRACAGHNFRSTFHKKCMLGSGVAAQATRTFEFFVSEISVVAVRVGGASGEKVLQRSKSDLV